MNHFIFLRTHQINIGPISGTNYTTNKFFDSLDISVVKVNPETEMIDEDNNLNTDTRVWLEFGPGIGKALDILLEYVQENPELNNATQLKVIAHGILLSGEIE